MLAALPVRLLARGRLLTGLGLTVLRARLAVAGLLALAGLLMLAGLAGVPPPRGLRGRRVLLLGLPGGPERVEGLLGGLGGGLLPLGGMRARGPRGRRLGRG